MYICGMISIMYQVADWCKCRVRSMAGEDPVSEKAVQSAEALWDGSHPVGSRDKALIRVSGT